MFCNPTGSGIGKCEGIKEAIKVNIKQDRTGVSISYTLFYNKSKIIKI